MGWDCVQYSWEGIVNLPSTSSATCCDLWAGRSPGIEPCPVDGPAAWRALVWSGMLGRAFRGPIGQLGAWASADDLERTSGNCFETDPGASWIPLRFQKLDANTPAM